MNNYFKLRKGRETNIHNQAYALGRRHATEEIQAVVKRAEDKANSLVIQERETDVKLMTAIAAGQEAFARAIMTAKKY